MSDLKSGTTVGGSSIWTQSNLLLMPTGDQLTYKGWIVYTENNKPSAEDIGALSLANGGIVAKNTTFQQNITVSGTVNSSQVNVSVGETISRSDNAAFLSFVRSDLTNIPVVETSVQEINSYNGNSQLLGAYTVSQMTSGGNKIALRGYKDGVQNTLFSIDTQSKQISVEQGTFRVVEGTTLSTLSATTATFSGNITAPKINLSDWSNIDPRYMTGYGKALAGSSFASVADKNDVYTINASALTDGPKGNATYVGILVNYRSIRNDGISLVQKYFDSDGVTYVRKATGSSGAYTWIGGDLLNGWSKVYDSTNKPTPLELGAAKSGVNNDITSLTALSGPLRLGGDGVNDYDAVTLRQARNMGGGTGPTQSGVMNYGVGSKRIHDSRAWISPYEVFLDGQLLLRSQWPDLWAYAQLVGAISDSTWAANPGKRGKYTTGDGSTTFRVPDLNGVKKNGDESGYIVGDSIAGLFARGDGGVSSNNGNVLQNAAPNISGYILPAYAGTLSIIDAGTGPFTLTPPTVSQTANLASIGSAATSRNSAVTFNANKSNAAYGRDGATEVYPNSVVGVWVVRASGGFTAANTSWAVINGDSSAPSSGVKVYGGDVISQYSVGGNNYASATLRILAQSTGEVYPQIVSKDNRGSEPVTEIFDMRKLRDPIVMTWREAVAAGWLSFHPATSSGDDELLVTVYPDRITIDGIWRVTGNKIAPTAIMYNVLKVPDGWSDARKSMLPCMNNGSNEGPVTWLGFSRHKTTIYPIGSQSTGVGFEGWGSYNVAALIVREEWHFKR